MSALEIYNSNNENNNENHVKSKLFYTSRLVGWLVGLAQSSDMNRLNNF